MLSVVIPVYDEGESLAQLHAELRDVARRQAVEIEIVFVDDGSRDATWSEIERLANQDSQVHGIRLRRNFGKAAALSAGFDVARGDLVFTMDGDLQDDPAEIPRFLAAIAQGDLDVVTGWKQVRHDPRHKVVASRVFNFVVGLTTGVKLHDHNCGFKCFRREVLSEIRLYGELHRFIPVLAEARGWKVGEIGVQHRPRRFGRSKYGFRRIVKGFLDLFTVCFLTSFKQRPQHLLGSLGLSSFLVGGLGGFLLAVRWVLTRLDSDLGNDLHLSRQAVFYVSLAAMLVGVQLLSLGLVAELAAALHRRDCVPYSIRQRTDHTRRPDHPLPETNGSLESPEAARDAVDAPDLTMLDE